MKNKNRYFQTTRHQIFNFTAQLGLIRGLAKGSDSEFTVHTASKWTFTQRKTAISIIVQETTCPQGFRTGFR